MPRLTYSEELCLGLLVAVLQLAAHQPAQSAEQALLLQVLGMSLRLSGRTPGPEQKLFENLCIFFRSLPLGQASVT